MDCTKSILDTVLTCWERTATYRRYIRSLSPNLDALRTAMDELDKVYSDVGRKVSADEGRRRIRTDEVRGWLGRVEALKKEVEEILVDGGKIMERNCLCGLCCWNCRPRYKHSQLAEEKKSHLTAQLDKSIAFRDDGSVSYEPADLILETSLDALRLKKNDLQGRFDTVKQQVEREEKRHMVVRTPEVDVWWKTVEGLLGEEVTEILDKGKAELEKRSKDGKSNRSPRDSALYHGLAKDADKLIITVEGKLKEGHGFTTLTCKHNDPPVSELPLECYVSDKTVFKEVWDWVEDEAVRCIGILGMGGAGKTTLLHRVNNEFLKVRRHHYNFSLLVVVSRPLNLDKIQEAILQELRVPKDEWGGRDRIGRSSLILTHMKEKNFLLFLDDLWDPIDLLNDLGVPSSSHPQKCKIMFTTRDEGVCNRMKPDKTKKVDCLPHDEALRLFRLMLGEKTWGANLMIPKIAATLVSECKYLPLAIVTVARAMTGTTELKYWMNAEMDMKSRVSKFADMEKEVLTRLEFSYERLPDEIHKMCFLYLSIFPEDHEISEGDAIDLWIGEGFLNGCGNAHEACSYGAKIFARLTSACLVEFVRSSTLLGKIVKMHDHVREMALWVDSGHGSERNRVLVRQDPESLTREDLEKWKDAKRISLWRAESGLYDSLTTCSRLSTLIIRDTYLEMIPEEFFLAMPRLRVLDISGNDYLVGLPDSIWKLMELRHLNLNILTEERLTLVPEKIRNLDKLEVMILSRNFEFPIEAISQLSSLRVYRCSDVNIDWTAGTDNDTEALRNLQQASLCLHSVEAVDKLLGDPRLPILLRGLSLYQCVGLDFLSIPTSQLKRLRSLALFGCRTVKRIEIDEGANGRHSLSPRRPLTFASPDSLRSLRSVLIIGCERLVDVTPLICHAPMLETLHIGYCGSLAELVAGELFEDSHHDTENLQDLFPCLAYLRLDYLTSLERICRRALPFPSLREIQVVRCRELKKLPLNCDSAKNTLQAIKGDEGWWKGLEWDDPAAKRVFSPKFVSSGDFDINTK